MHHGTASSLRRAEAIFPRDQQRAWPTAAQSDGRQLMDVVPAAGCERYSSKASRVEDGHQISQTDVVHLVKSDTVQSLECS